MKQIATGVLSLLALAAFALPEPFSVEKNGVVKVDGVPLQLIRWGNQWKSFMQRTKGTVSGEPVWKDGNVALRGRFGGMEFLQTVSAAADRVEYRARLASEQEVLFKDFGAEIELEAEALRQAPLVVDGVEYGFRDLYDPKRNSITLEGRREVRIPLRGGILCVSGKFNLLIQDNRRFRYPTVSVRFRGTPNTGSLKAAELNLDLGYTAYRPARPVRLHAAANMGFRDERAEDRTGGWTDQGPENDLRMFPVKQKQFGGLPFEIADPARNRGRGCIALRGGGRSYFPDAASVETGGAGGAFLYLLHALAWVPARGTVIGTIQAEYENGETLSLPVRAGVDAGNFWAPFPLRNGRVAWRGKNPSSSVGLYLSAFPLNPSLPLRRLTFRSSGKAVWLIVGAALSDRRVAVQEYRTFTVDPEKYALLPSFGRPAPGSVLDLSHLLDAPAGKYGFVRNAAGQFEFEKRPGVPVRFYGTNLCFDAQFMTPEETGRLLDDLARTGYNLVRLHHFDGLLARRKGGRSTTLDPEKLAQLDVLAAGAIQRGLYLTLDLFTLRKLEKGEIPEFPGRALYPDEFKALAFLYDSVMENFEAFAGNLLNHVNPHTGRAWKLEPAIITIGLINEDTIFQVATRGWVGKLYRERFRQWKQQRAVRGNDDLLWRQFLSELYLRGYARMAGFIRSLGTRAMLTDSNFLSDPAVTLLRNSGDMVDNHVYWIHPKSLGKSWSFPALVRNESATRNFVGGVAELLPTRIYGRPFTVTEWNYVAPSPYTSEGAFLMGAYASLQQWGAVCRFAYSHNAARVRKAEEQNYFDMVVDPVRLLSERAGSLFFHRGDVKGARERFAVYLSERYLEDAGAEQQYPAAACRAGLIGQIGSVIGGGAAALPPETRGVFTLEKTGIDFPVPLLNRKAARRAAGIQPERNCVLRSTGELKLDCDAGNFLVVTPRSEGFVLCPGQTLAGKFATVANREAFGSVLVAAVDEKPLRESRRILILHLTEVKNSNMRFADPELTIVEFPGTLPLLVRRGEVELTLDLPPGPWRLYPVGFDGIRQGGALPLRQERGKSRVTLRTAGPHGVTGAYELIR